MSSWVRWKLNFISANKAMSELPQIKCELNMLSNEIIIRLPLITLNHVCTDMTGCELDYEKLMDRILNDNDPDTGRTTLQQYIEDNILDAMIEFANQTKTTQP